MKDGGREQMKRTVSVIARLVVTVGVESCRVVAFAIEALQVEAFGVVAIFVEAVLARRVVATLVKACGEVGNQREQEKDQYRSNAPSRFLPSLLKPVRSEAASAG